MAAPPLICQPRADYAWERTREKVVAKKLQQLRNRGGASAHFPAVALPANFDIYTTKNEEEANEWVRQFVGDLGDPTRVRVVGFDCEWKPMFDSGPVEDYIDVLQVATSLSCLLWQTQRTLAGTAARALPYGLRVMMEDTGVTKVGVGVAGDVGRVRNFFGVNTRGVVEINDLVTRNGARSAGYGRPARLGMGAVCSTVLGKQYIERPDVTLSRWDASELDADQRTYAALDAWIPLQAYGVLARN